MTSQPATPTATGQLSGRVCRPAELSAAQRRRMIDLLHEFFENVTADQFEHDLSEKEWVVLLCDSGSDEIQGFSTLMQMQLRVDDRPVTAFYSGDTIIHPDYWQEAELPRVWGRHVFAQAEAVSAREPGSEVVLVPAQFGLQDLSFPARLFPRVLPVAHPADAAAHPPHHRCAGRGQVPRPIRPGTRHHPFRHGFAAARGRGRGHRRTTQRPAYRVLRPGEPRPRRGRTACMSRAVDPRQP